MAEMIFSGIVGRFHGKVMVTIGRDEERWERSFPNLAAAVADLESLHLTRDLQILRTAFKLDRDHADAGTYRILYSFPIANSFNAVALAESHFLFSRVS